MRSAVYAATKADHSSGVRVPPSRLRSMSGTTNITGPPPHGVLDARRRVPADLPRPARGARRPGAAHGGGAHRAGDSAHAALAPQQALGHYRAALAHDSTNYAALWKAGREAVDLAKQIEGKDDSSKQVRDSLYVMARAYGEAAARVNPNGADGHFTIGQALGRLSRTKGGKERVRFAKIIFDEGMKALECDSTHDGA